MELRGRNKQTCLQFPEVKKRTLRSKSKCEKTISAEPKNKTFCSPQKRNTPQKGEKRLFIAGQFCNENESPSKKICSPNKKTPQKINTNYTPNVSLSRLKLNSPLKERADENKTVKTPRKELFPSNFQDARKAFHSSAPHCLIGREKQIEDIEAFLFNHLKNQTSGSLYISGPPGTGKTASVNKVLENSKISDRYQSGYVNCTSVQTSGAVYARIIQSLKIRTKAKSEKDYTTAIDKYLSRKHKMLLLILDEIDQLATRTQSVLYTIFEWPSRIGSRIVLIGIANAMDLTDKILPRLCMKVELKPKLLHFGPYSKQEIINILNHRLVQVGAVDVFASSALELIAGKVAAASGDIRKALDLSRRVLEISGSKSKVTCSITPNSLLNQSKQYNEEQSTEKSPRKSPRKTYEPLENKTVIKELNEGKSPRKLAKELFQETSPSKTNTKIFTPEKKISEESTPRKSPRKVSKLVLDSSPVKPNSIIDSIGVMNVVRDIYNTAKSLKSDESSYPLHQKLLICSLLLMLKKGKNKDINIGKLHQVYSRVCTKRGITGVDQSGFIFLCRQVEMSGVVHLGKGQGKLVKISLQWDESEISNALKDNNLLFSVLNDISYLS